MEYHRNIVLLGQSSVRSEEREDKYDIYVKNIEEKRGRKVYGDVHIDHVHIASARHCHCLSRKQFESVCS